MTFAQETPTEAIQRIKLSCIERFAGEWLHHFGLEVWNAAQAAQSAPLSLEVGHVYQDAAGKQYIAHGERFGGNFNVGEALIDGCATPKQFACKPSGDCVSESGETLKLVGEVPVGPNIFDRYDGHLSDGSSVQKHSAGPLYPCVIYQQETPDGLKSGIITPGCQTGQLIGTYTEAVEAAQRYNQAAKNLASKQTFC